MRLFSTSSSSPKPNFPLFSPSQNPKRSTSKTLPPFKTRLPSPSFLSLPPCTANSSPSFPVLDQEADREDSLEPKQDTFKKVLVVRRPVMDVSGEENDDGSEDGEAEGDDFISKPSGIDAGLEEFAKKMPLFEPERSESGGTLEKPLAVNLDLSLYKARVLARKYRYEEAEKILEKCICYWPEDGRSYVTLGKILSKQAKRTEARAVYERGCQATQGENPYIWQCWAVLENKMRNIRRARELFDAATVADKRHIAAWHGWAVLELKQGNVKKARHLLAKGLKFCGGNEYVYQTLALLEAKANRYEQARYLFRQATKCNPKSCASWLAWAQLEVQQENNRAARLLFEKAVQASPKNRFAWHVWGVFEANIGNVDMGRKLLKIGHALNPRDPVLLQSLALLEYKHSTANLARVLFRRASELDPRHQPVWIAWGWMEWKEGNISTARELYQRALSIDSTTESAARCLQAWGVLEQRAGNLSAARRLFRSSLNINSQSYVTWMTWAALEEDQGNSVRAEEIRNLYFQQRTEVVDDASWVTGFLDVIDPALDSIKRLLNLDQGLINKAREPSKDVESIEDGAEEPFLSTSLGLNDGNDIGYGSRFDLNAFIKDKLSLDPSKLDLLMENSGNSSPKRVTSPRRMWRSQNRTIMTLP
ncbi:psbB mRNA maturation factor Mbb1, chloroplastic [Gossypium australe]|uniref:PsbB mRNA maturation factor Mbb1, chloroplastic n=1 Tax=Gossypium australe TaxID=47621 RepID=A0A5B6WIC8_9ROSI|nr:psbB mRNA maturation factor Mbb1, chloroplastic [Gossypium australe]